MMSKFESLTLREDTVMLGQILVYTMNGCPHCTMLKSTLNQLNLPFIDVQLDLYTSDVRKNIKKFTNKSSGNYRVITDSL